MANPESLAREIVDAVNRNDMKRYRELLHTEYSYRSGDGQVQRGRTQVSPSFRCIVLPSLMT